MPKSFYIKGIPYKFVKFDTIGDGSCLLHSILFSFNKTYRSLSYSDRIKMVDSLREYLSNVLEEKENKKTYYENLSRGEMMEFGKYVREANIEYMKKYLKTRKWLSVVYLELISNQLNIDIIILDQKNRKIYNTGDKEIYFKNRNTVIINYIEDTHFESVGIELGNIKTFFDPNCEIIKNMKKMI